MRRFFIVLLCLTSVKVNAYEALCEVKDNELWDKIPEQAFSLPKVQLRVNELKLQFDSGEILAEEWLYETLIYIEGGALRQSVEYWSKQKNTKSLEAAKKDFCDFVSKAYLVH